MKMNEITFDHALSDGTLSTVNVRRSNSSGVYLYSYIIRDNSSQDVLFTETNLVKSEYIRSMDSMGVDYDKYSMIFVSETESFTHIFTHITSGSEKTFHISRRYDGVEIRWDVEINPTIGNAYARPNLSHREYVQFMTVEEMIPENMIAETIPEAKTFPFGAEGGDYNYTVDRRWSDVTLEPCFDCIIRHEFSQDIKDSDVDMNQNEFVDFMNRNNIENGRYRTVLISENYTHTLNGVSENTLTYEGTKVFSTPPVYMLNIKDQNGNVIDSVSDYSEIQFIDRMDSDGVPLASYKPLIDAEPAGEETEEFFLEETIYFKPSIVGGLKSESGYDIYMYRHVDAVRNRYYSLSIKNLDIGAYLYRDDLKYDIFKFIEICESMSLSYPQYKDIIADEDKDIFFVTGDSVKLLKADMQLTSPFRATLNISRIKNINDVIAVLSLMDISVTKEVLDNLPDDKKYYFSR